MQTSDADDGGIARDSSARACAPSGHLRPRGCRQSRLCRLDLAHVSQADRIQADVLDVEFSLFDLDLRRIEEDALTDLFSFLIYFQIENQNS